MFTYKEKVFNYVKKIFFKTKKKKKKKNGEKKKKKIIKLETTTKSFAGIPSMEFSLSPWSSIHGEKKKFRLIYLYKPHNRLYKKKRLIFFAR